MKTWRCLAVVFGILTITAPADAQMWQRAHQAYASGDFAGALRHFDAARASIGERYSEVAERWSPAALAAHEASRCPHALSRLALRSRANDDSWGMAIEEANYACGDAEKAVAALLMGDVLQAALRVSDLQGSQPSESGASPFAAPFADRRLPPAVQSFALVNGELPPARNVEEARRYVRALAQLRYGLSAECGAARGVAWTAPTQYQRAVDCPALLDDPETEPVPLAPFSGDPPDALGTISCSYPARMAPEDRGNDEPLTEVFLLRQESGGQIRVRGSYPRRFLECTNYPVQNEVANFAMPGAGLYAFVRASGYSNAPNVGNDLISVEANICDLERGRCRSLPIQIRGTGNPGASTEPVVRRLDWRSSFSVRGGRLRLSALRGAPAGLARFRRGVSLDDFFSSPSVEVTIPSTDVECPVIIADSDGRTNVRRAPASGAEALAVLSNGTEIRVEERRGRWWRITSPQAGWVWGPNTEARCSQ